MRKHMNRNITLSAAAAALAVLLGTALALPAQQAPAVSQLVPGNPLHPAAPAQPLPFSHKKHLAFSLQCKACHTNPDPGNMMTFPATAKCMSCHASIAKTKPAILKLAEFSKSQKPIPWVRVYTVLPGVTWTHRAHLAAGMQCEMCHGPVAQMDAMSEATSVTTMFSCLDCHQKKGAKTICSTCHKS